jgi:hypothetical protein
MFSSRSVRRDGSLMKDASDVHLLGAHLSRNHRLPVNSDKIGRSRFVRVDEETTRTFESRNRLPAGHSGLRLSAQDLLKPQSGPACFAPAAVRGRVRRPRMVDAQTADPSSCTQRKTIAWTAVNLLFFDADASR